MPNRIYFVAMALNALFGAIATSCLPHRSAKDQKAPETNSASKRMPDGKQWTIENLNVNTDGSYCYEDAESNCRRYGHLYTWDSARRGCELLGDGWRLPTEDDWRQLAKHFGGVFDDSNDAGQIAYKALLIGGHSGFNALLGGSRVGNGQYSRLDAHGFYWTISESDSGAWFYNFGRGSLALYRQRDGNKRMAVSVRCVKE